MHIKAVLFDLDGTLLPMDQDVFVKYYFKAMATKLAPLGYEPQKLMDAIWAGTGAMVKNDGSRLNEEAFWEVFAGVFGPESLKDKPIVDSFYENEFVAAKEACAFQPLAREVVDLVKASGRQAVLATNPIFPAVGTRRRVSWAGLTPEDFLHITTYENSSTCKPNPQYYRDVLAHIGCAPEECLMVGNDVGEDMVARTLGMDVFLVTDCLINRRGEDISAYPHGTFADLIDYLKNLD